MRIARSIRELNLDTTRSIGFVPTMGAFHEGHLSLMRRARADTQQVVVSLFVNPLQFGHGEDYSLYPRDELRDAEMAEREAVDVIFVPSSAEMFPRETTQVMVPGVTRRWEGEHRPGHFDGVATVVCKLFNIVRPDKAYFGRKDLQQCAVVRRMAADLNMSLEIVLCETIREPDGLAMSSRNQYLSNDERNLAAKIFAALSSLKRDIQGLNDERLVRSAIDDARSLLEVVGVKVQYLALVDTNTLEPRHLPMPGSSLIIAGYVGRTRLIDNVQVL